MKGSTENATGSDFQELLKCQYLEKPAKYYLEVLMSIDLRYFDNA